MNNVYKTITGIFILALLTAPSGVLAISSSAPPRYETLTVVQNQPVQIPSSRYQEWEQLPPEEKERLRQKWQYYKNLPPREQQLYKNRYEEWKRLPPEERRKIQEKLRNWEELSPEEQEAIRQKFRR